MSELPEVYSDNILNLSAATVSIASGDYAATKKRLYDYRTARQWTADSAAAQTISADAGNSIAIDALAIANHNLSGVALTFTGSGDPAFPAPTTIDSWTPADNGDQLRRVSVATFRYFRLSVAAAAQAASIGELHIGPRLQFPVNPSIPHDTGREIDLSEVRISRHGRKTARQRFKKKQIRLRLAMMSEAEYEPLKTWWKSVRTFKPFFYAFNPATEPEDVVFVRNANPRFRCPLKGPIRTLLELLFEQVR